MPGEQSSSDTRRRWPLLVLVGVLFVVSRLLVLPFPQPTSDIEIYARYAHELAAAWRTGQSFYTLHVQQIDRQTEAARAAGTLIGSLEEYKNVEYPPVALAAMYLPTLWMPSGALDGPFTPAYLESYRLAYRVGAAVVDALLFVLVCLLAWRLYGHEADRLLLLRLLAYLACTMALWHLLYDRLDLWMALLVVLSLALLLLQRHYAAAYVVLALAIAFKIVPVVLAPLWLVASLPAALVHQANGRLLLALGTRSLLLGTLLLAGFLPFYMAAGAPALGFLTYHRVRGLEIGSIYSSFLLMLESIGHDVQVDYSYGGINVISPLAPVLVTLAPWLTAALLSLATLMLIRDVYVVTRREPPGTLGATFAQEHPGLVVGYALLFLMLSVAASKVFSPQYLLWLAPLVCLTSFPPRTQRLLMGGFLLVCLLSTLLVPFLVLLDMYDPAAPATVPRSFKPPTARVILLLAIRNVAFVALTAGVAVELFSAMRRGAVTTSASSAPA